MGILFCNGNEQKLSSFRYNGNEDCFYTGKEISSWGNNHPSAHMATQTSTA